MAGIIVELDAVVTQQSLARLAADLEKATATMGTGLAKGATAPAQAFAKSLISTLQTRLQTESAILSKQLAEGTLSPQAYSAAAKRLGSEIMKDLNRGIKSGQKLELFSGEGGIALRNQLQGITAAATQAGRAVSTAIAPIGAVGTTAAKAAPGLNTVRSAMVSLASQAAGVPGPLGSMASSLLMFAGGGALALTAAAGLGALALAIGFFTKKAKEGREAAAALIAETRNLGRSPVQIIEGQIGERETKIGETRQRLADLEKTRAALRAQGGGLFLTQQQYDEEKKTLAGLEDSLKRLREQQRGLIEAAGLESISQIGGGTPVATRVAEAVQAVASAGTLNEQVIAQGAAAAAEAIKTGAELTSGVITDITEQWEAENTERLGQIAGQASAEEQAIQQMMAANVDVNSMLAEWDEQDRERKKAGHIEHLAHLEEQAFRLENIVSNTLAIADAWGLVSKELGGVLSSLSRVATDAAGFAKSLATGDVLGAIGSGINLIGNIGGALGIKGKSPRYGGGDGPLFSTINAFLARAEAGQLDVIQQVDQLRKTDRDKKQWQQFWDTDLRRALVTPEQVALMSRLNGSPVQATTASTAAGTKTAEEAASAAAEAERLRLEGITTGEERQVAERLQKDELAGEQGLRDRAATLGDQIVAQVEQAIAASRAADRLAEQSPLGQESPLAQDARRRADEAIREAERVVEDAQREKERLEGKTDDKVSAGFSVERTITESSAGRLIGELTTISTYTSWLPKIHDLLAGRAPVGGGAGGSGGGTTVEVHAHTYLDGREIAETVSEHQYRAFQDRAALNGNTSMGG